MRKIIILTASVSLAGLLLSGTAMAQSVSGSATVSGSAGQAEGTVMKRRPSTTSGSVSVEHQQRSGTSVGIQSRSEERGTVSVRTHSRMVEQPSIEVRHRQVTSVEDEPETVVHRKRVVRYSSPSSHKVVVVRHKHRHHYVEEPSVVVKHKHRIVRYEDEPTYSVTRRTHVRRYESEPSASISVRSRERTGLEVQTRNRTEVTGRVSRSTNEPQGSLTGKARGTFGAEGHAVVKRKIQGGTQPGE